MEGLIKLLGSVIELLAIYLNRHYGSRNATGGNNTDYPKD
jgi:hypothetical protein